MTQEDKELSFIDISGRLHYGVIVNYKENEYDHRKWKITSLHTFSYSKSCTLIDTDYDGWISYEEHQGCGMSTGSRHFRFGEVLPYLRPISSMTEEEMDRLFDILYVDKDGKGEDWIKINDIYGILFFFPTGRWVETIAEAYDYLNSIHIDYRGLISKGLAVAVTKENNPYKE